MEMTVEQAVNNLKVALVRFVGTRQEHIALEESLKFLEGKATGEQEKNE